MAAHKIGLELWVGAMALSWSCYPLLFSQVQGVVVLSGLTALLALLGGVTGWQPLVAWSGGLGLCNLTVALLVIAHPPNLWTGLSAGLILFAFVDGSHRLTYLRQCWLEPGVITALGRTFIRLSSLALGSGLLLGMLIIPLGHAAVMASAAGVITIAGACIVVGLLAIILLSQGQ
jgi:hypothetical protein